MPRIDPHPARRTRAFALPELACVALLVAVVLALALIMGDDTRRNARIGHDLSKFRTIYAGKMSYAADSQDVLPTFTWRAGNHTTPYPDLAFADSDMVAAMQQMVHIVRMRGGRPQAETPQIFNLVANANHQHLVLCEYLDLPVPSPLFISAADRHRLLWVNDPRGYDLGHYQPNLGTGGTNWRHPYGTSFTANTYLFDRSPLGRRLYPATTTSVWVPGGHVFGGAPMSELSHPSQKVLLHDRLTRFFGPAGSHAARPESRLPFLMADGAAAVKSTGESNLGCDPNSGTVVQLGYLPTAIEPPSSPPNTTVYVYGRFMWTRGRIGGRDFGGPEVPN